MKVASCELPVSCVGDVGGIFEAASGTKKCRIVVGATHTHTRTCPETEHHISVCRPVSIVARVLCASSSLVSLFLWLGLLFMLRTSVSVVCGSLTKLCCC